MTGLCSWEVIRGEMRSSVIPECRRIALCKEARRVFPVSHSSLPPLFSLVDRNQERRRLLHQRSSSSFLHSLHSQIRDSEVKKFDDVCIGSNPFLLFSSVEDIRRETRSFSTGRRSQGEQQDRGVHSLSSQARYHSLLEQEDHHKEKKEEDGGRQGRKSQAEEDQVRKGGAEDKCRRKREGEKEEEKVNTGDARYSEATVVPSREKPVKGSEGTCIYIRARGAGTRSGVLVSWNENDECFLPSSSSCSPCLKSPEENSLPPADEHSRAPSSFSPVTKRFSQKHRKGKFMLKGYKGLHSALKIREFLAFDNDGDQTKEESGESASQSSASYEFPSSTGGETENDKQGCRWGSECTYTSASLGELPEETVGVRETGSNVSSDVEEGDISSHSHAISKQKDVEQQMKENALLSSRDVHQNQPLNTVGCTYTPRGGGGRILQRTEDQIFFDTLQQLSRSKGSSLHTCDDFYRLPPLSLATKNMRRFPCQPPRPSSSSFSERSLPCDLSILSFPRDSEERREEEEKMTPAEKREIESNLADLSQDGVHPRIRNLSLPKLRYLEELFSNKNEERLLERQRRRGRRKEMTLEDGGEEELQEEMIVKERPGNNCQEEEGTKGVYDGVLEKDRREEALNEKKRKEESHTERTGSKTEAVHPSIEGGHQERKGEEKEETERSKNDDEEERKKKMILAEELRSYLLFYTRVGIHHLELESLFRLFFERYLHTFSLHELQELQTLIHFTPSSSSSSSSLLSSSPSPLADEERDNTRNTERRDSSVREKKEEKKEVNSSMENSECFLPSGMTQQKDNRRKNSRKKSKHRSPDGLNQLGFLFSLLNGTAQELPSELKSNQTLKLFLTFLYEEHPLLSQFTDCSLHSAPSNLSSSLSSERSKISQL